FEPAPQLLRALLGGQRPPGRQGPVGRLDGPAGFRGTQLRHRTKDLAGGRVVHRNGLAAVGIHPGAVDMVLLAEQSKLFELQERTLGQCPASATWDGKALWRWFCSDCHPMSVLARPTNPFERLKKS